MAWINSFDFLGALIQDDGCTRDRRPVRTADHRAGQAPFSLRLGGQQARDEKEDAE